MKSIKVLGPGCPKCDKLAAAAKEAADALGIAYEFEKVTDITKYADYGLMLTPGLVVDGKLEVQGKVPPTDEIKALLTKES